MSINVKIDLVSNNESTIIFDVDDKIILWHAIATFVDVPEDVKKQAAAKGPKLPNGDETEYQWNAQARTIEAVPLIDLIIKELLDDQAVVGDQAILALKNKYPQEYNEMISLCQYTNQIIDNMQEEKYAKNQS
ncbi:hypothetical protein [Limosilactobacillus mucosae]|uniref:hypothetical protein n=1 Tax=Limosilactobacillus mucosae TaxID=97478 RepID=UPI00399463A4